SSLCSDSPSFGWVPGFVAYQWGKPQLDECENAKGASLPAIAFLPMLLPSAIADPRDESLGKNAQLALAGGCPPQISH
ncbi:MAG: hypothetical protein J7M32_04640, partial [Deltaproteobacteria bacterium]|nr:hypothetical protein [Deltaproteobacteria bacterium]